MQIPYRSPYKYYHRVIRYCLVISLFSVMLSCGTQTSVQVIGSQSNSTSIKPRHIVFKGSDYIVLKLKGNETSASLAKTFLSSDKKAWIIEDANKATSYQEGQIVIIPVKQKNIGGVTTKGYQTVPVLGYNRIDNGCDGPLCITSHVFELQMKYLRDNGYRVISMMDLLNFLNYKKAIPEKSIVITIEDSLIATYNKAIPVLNKYGFQATFFFNIALMDQDQNTITWNQAKELKANGFEVGLSVPSQYNMFEKKDDEDVSFHMARIKTMLLRSKKEMDEMLSQNTIYIALPTDEDNAFLINICNQVGYKIAVSRQEGNNPFFADPLALKRNIVQEQGMETFIAKLKTFQASPLR